MAALWHVGHTQVEVGLNDEARATLHRALAARPAVTGDFNKDHWGTITLGDLVKTLTRAGDREHAREAAKHMEAFS